MPAEQPNATRLVACTVAAIAGFIAAGAILAVTLPDVVSIGACSTTGKGGPGLRSVPFCTEDQTRSIVMLFVGVLVAVIASAFTTRQVRGREALPLRLIGLGLVGVVAGGLAELRLREPEVIAAMTPQDLDGWKIGMLPLLIGGAVCVLLGIGFALRDASRR